MQELSMHGLGAKIDFNNFVQAINNDEMRQTRIVWFNLTSFLSHAAMISKYLSPINPKGFKKDRMHLLREKLCIENDSDVLPRDARDNVEHFDERIDNWIGTDNNTILEIVFPDRASYDFMSSGKKRIKRVLLLEELIFISEKKDGEKFELELMPLFDEVKRIGDDAVEWIENSSPYHFIYP